MVADPSELRSAVGRGGTALVGRASEMTRFVEALGSGVRGIVLHGGPGVGKTRLAEELVAAAAARGHVTRFVRGRASTEDLPLGPFAPLLPTGLDRVEGVSLLVTARLAIEQLGQGRPVVLGVDDAQLLDPTSATLVHQLVSARSVVLVATVRDGEWVPDPITELWRSGTVQRWAVGELGDDDVVAMAEGLLGEPVPPGVGDELVRLTGGNPLFVSSLARAMKESGPTGESIDVSSATAAPTLVDFVSARLAVLDPATRDALAVVALGEPIGLQVLERLTDGQSLVELERGGWLEVIDSGRRIEVRLAHPLYGEVLRRTLSRLLARSVYRELASAVQNHGARRRDDLLRVALWSIEGGAPLPPDQLMRAAEEAGDAGDFDLAERLAESVWDAQHRFDAGFMLLFLHETRRFQEDRDGFLAALERCTTTPQQRAIVATTRAFEAFWRNGDLPAALAFVDAAAEAAGDDEARDELLAQRASLLATSGQADAARTLARALATSPSARTRMTALLAERMVETVFGDPSGVVQRLDAALAETVTSELGMLPLRVIHAGFNRPLVQLGQLHRAEQLVRSVVETGASARMAGTPEYHLGWTLVWRGRPVEGYRFAHQAAAHQRREGFRTLERWSRTAMALAAVYAGDVGLAEAALQRVEQLSPNPATVYDGDLWQARSVLDALRGDREGAVRWARRGAAESAELGKPFDEAVAWFGLGQLGLAAEAADRLGVLGERLGGLAEMFAELTLARSRRDATGMGDAAERLHLAGAEAIAASATVDAARTAARAGDERAAARWTRRAVEIAGAVDETHSLVVLPEVEQLSRREREVAELAASGMPSRDIAERLFLSTRTVDNHLAKVFDKLGVGSRADLPAALAAAPGV